MRNFPRTIFAYAMLVPFLLTGIEASACQPPAPIPLQQALDEAVGVVRAKVMATRVRNSNEVRASCDAVICEILEVDLDIAEVFKGDGQDFEIVYAPVPFMCVLIVLPGWEYVLFLEKQNGVIFASESSFATGYSSLRTQSQAEADRLAELRRLTAK